MPSDPSSEAWAQMRYDYEFTDRTVEEICAEHGISSGTLRDRMRRWGWTRRREPIPREGPLPAPPPQTETSARAWPFVREDAGASSPAPALSPAAAPPIEMATPPVIAAPLPSPHYFAGSAVDGPGDDDAGAIVPRLQSAVSRLLPAIEAIVAKLGGEFTHPREMERACRALVPLTRTLRDLNTLMSQHQAAAAAGAEDDPPRDIDEFRRELARRIDAMIESEREQAIAAALERDPPDWLEADEDESTGAAAAAAGTEPPDWFKKELREHDSRSVRDQAAESDALPSGDACLDVSAGTVMR